MMKNRKSPLTLQELFKSPNPPKLVGGIAKELLPTLIGKYIITLHHISSVGYHFSFTRKVISVETKDGLTKVIIEYEDHTRKWTNDYIVGENDFQCYVIWEE